MATPTIATPQVVKYICQRFNIRMSKKFGQNFLIRPDIIERIVETGHVQEEDHVLEIGPGIGTLTQGLAEAGATVTAVELDKRLIDVLDHTLEDYENVTIVQGDILKIDIDELMGYGPFKVIANLPYYITTPIIMHLLEHKVSVSSITVMVQKEVAQRMVAEPGSKTYGALSVAVQYYTEPHIAFDVPRQSFLPAPEVTSAVIHLDVRKEPPVSVADEKKLFQMVKGAFAQRRKTLQNTLRTTGLSKEAIRQILDASEIDGARRGETLSLQDFARLANTWSTLEKDGNL